MSTDKFITAAEAFEITSTAKNNAVMASVEECIVQAASAGRCVARCPIEGSSETHEFVLQKLEQSGFKILDCSVIGGLTATVSWGTETLTGLRPLE